MEYHTKRAVFDLREIYRYQLIRTWNPDKPLLCYIMLNPSTADGETDDPTVKKCVGFAERAGYGGMIVVNLFGLRSTDPAKLHTHSDPVGPTNNKYIKDAVGRCQHIVAAWGSNGVLNGRDLEVLKLLAQHNIYCLGTTAGGIPRHPLYIGYDTKMQLYRTGNGEVFKCGNPVIKQYDDCLRKSPDCCLSCCTPCRLRCKDPHLCPHKIGGNANV